MNNPANNTNNVRRKVTISICAYVLLCILFCFLAYLFIKYTFIIGFEVLSCSNYFAIKQIDIACNDQNLKEEALLLAGVDRGQNLLKQNLRELKSRILRHPAITQVHLKRIFPDTLKISLITREPIAIAMLDRLYYVDQNGFAYRQVSLTDNCDLPIITGVMCEDRQETEKRLRLTARVLKEIMSLVNYAHLLEISELNYENENFVRLYLKNPRAFVKLYIPELNEELSKVTKAMAYLKDAGLLGKVTGMIPYYNQGVALVMAEGL